MRFKKKRHNWKEWVVAILVYLCFFGVPIWLLMIALITEKAVVWMILFAWMCISYSIIRRVENA